MVATEHTILIEEMNQSKIYRKQRLKAFCLSITVLLVMVILMIIEIDSSDRILGFKFEKEIEIVPMIVLSSNARLVSKQDALKFHV